MKVITIFECGDIVRSVNYVLEILCNFVKSEDNKDVSFANRIIEQCNKLPEKLVSACKRFKLIQK